MYALLAALIAATAVFVPNETEGRNRGYYGSHAARHHYYNQHRAYSNYYYDQYTYPYSHKGKVGFYFEIAPGFRVILNGGKEYHHYSPRYYNHGRHYYRHSRHRGHPRH